MSYRLEGSLLEVCDCNVLCPCWIGRESRQRHLPERARLSHREGGDEVLLKRAASWCEGEGIAEAAIDYAIAGHDVRRAVRLVGETASAMYASGRVPTLTSWFDWLDRVGALAEYPAAAAQAARIVYALTGRPAAADYWREAAERGADPGTAEHGCGCPACGPTCVVTVRNVC